MFPTLMPDDLIVTQMTQPADLEVGDIVTFGDPADGLVAHRVIELHVAGEQIEVVTRGDADALVEKWSVDRAAWVGKLVAQVPSAGAVFAPRGVVLAGGAGAVLACILVWARARRTGPPHEEPTPF